MSYLDVDGYERLLLYVAIVYLALLVVGIIIDLRHTAAFRQGPEGGNDLDAVRGGVDRDSGRDAAARSWSEMA